MRAVKIAFAALVLLGLCAAIWFWGWPVAASAASVASAGSVAAGRRQRKKRRAEAEAEAAEAADVAEAADDWSRTESRTLPPILIVFLLVPAQVFAQCVPWHVGAPEPGLYAWAEPDKAPLLCRCTPRERYGELTRLPGGCKAEVSGILYSLPTHKRNVRERAEAGSLLKSMKEAAQADAETIDAHAAEGVQLRAQLVRAELWGWLLAAGLAGALVWGSTR